MFPVPDSQNLTGSKIQDVPKILILHSILIGTISNLTTKGTYQRDIVGILSKAASMRSMKHCSKYIII
jgi:hypothetical protein